MPDHVRLILIGSRIRNAKRGRLRRASPAVEGRKLRDYGWAANSVLEPRDVRDLHAEAGERLARGGRELEVQVVDLARVDAAVARELRLRLRPVGSGHRAPVHFVVVPAARDADLLDVVVRARARVETGVGRGAAGAAAQ